MTERCGCGAGLISGLGFCVTCGAPRPQLVGAGVAAGPMPVTTGRHGVPAVWPQPGPVDARRPHPHLVAGGHPWPVAHPQPARAPQSSAPWIAGAAAIVVAAVVAALAVLGGPWGHSTSAQPAAVAAPVTTTVTAAPETTVTTAADSSSTGTDALTAQVATDRSDLEALSGDWVPQLSSKKVGTVADGITYGASDILGNYRSLAATYSGAKLLYSGDWPVFDGDDYWVVVVAQPFSTPAGANAWCAAQGLGRDDCFAKKLSHSGGPAGTTVQR